MRKPETTSTVRIETPPEFHATSKSAEPVNRCGKEKGSAPSSIATQTNRVARQLPKAEKGIAREAASGMDGPSPKPKVEAHSDNY